MTWNSRLVHAGALRVSVRAMATRAWELHDGEGRVRTDGVRRVFGFRCPYTDVGGKIGVTLGRTTSIPTLDQALWVAIRNRTRAISFGAYRSFINRVLCRDPR